MKLLVTGSRGFIGKNFCAHIKAAALGETLSFNRETDPAKLDEYAGACDFVFHLAGINRPLDDSGFAENVTLTEQLIQSLEKQGRNTPVLLASSVQAELDNPYGRSKKKAEEAVFAYAVRTGARVYVYRLPGVFGKWCRPHYNSVVATFCEAIAAGKPVKTNDPGAVVSLVYIDQVIEEFVNALHDQANRIGDFCSVGGKHKITVGDLAKRISDFREYRKSLNVIDISDELTLQLYSTYLSYLPENDFAYPLTAHADKRGCFAEFLKSATGGQISVNIAKPGSSKGGHWHHTKTEKILVICGSGVIQFQKIGEEKVISYAVSGGRMEVVDIPVGYVHTVTNTGEEDLVMVIWSNQLYDPQRPDTFPAKISEDTFNV